MSVLNSHISRITTKFRVQGPEIASILCAALFDFENVESFLWRAFAVSVPQLQTELEELRSAGGHGTVSPQQEYAFINEKGQAYFNQHSQIGHPSTSSPTKEPLFSRPRAAHSTKDLTTKDATFSEAQNAVPHACRLFYPSIKLVFSRLGDKNILPFAHVVLAFLKSMTRVPSALLYVEAQVPWDSIVAFLNEVSRSGAVESRFEGFAFPQTLSGTGRQLPEDFIMRGLVWAKHYFPPEFFEGQIVDEDERTLELPSHAAPRAERCLWLGIQLASVSHLYSLITRQNVLRLWIQLERWITYDSQTKLFFVTDFVQALESNGAYAFGI